MEVNILEENVIVSFCLGWKGVQRDSKENC